MIASGQAAGHRYRLFGLTLSSEIPLPELRELPPGPADVTIVTASLPPAQGRLPIPTPEGVVIDVPGVARFRISGGNRIEIDADPAASPHNLRLFLLGSAMGILLHQRGTLALHANAIRIGERAIAFAGPSGAGKSTLATAFHDRGPQVLTDDVCVVTPTDSGFLAEPGIPRIRLWRDAVTRSGRAPDALEPAFDDRDKFVLGMDEAVVQPAPLAAIYRLAALNDPGAAFRIEPMTGVTAAQSLVENSYRASWVPLIGDPQAHFAACLRLSEQVPMFRIRRPWNEDRIGETIDVIEAHLATL